MVFHTILNNIHSYNPGQHCGTENPAIPGGNPQQNANTATHVPLKRKIKSARLGPELTVISSDISVIE